MRRNLLLAACALALFPAAVPFAAAATVQAAAQTEDARLVAFLDEKFEERVARSPEYQTYLGRKTSLDRWDDRGPEAEDRERALLERQLEELRTGFDRGALSAEGQLNYDLFAYTLENDLRLDQFRMQRFPLSQFRGIHSNIPVFLANYHRVDSVSDAESYIARVAAVPEVLGQAADQLQARLDAGYPLPEFSYPLIEEGARNVADGSAVRADFEKKVEALDASEEEKNRLLTTFESAISAPYAAGYAQFADRVGEMIGSEVIDGDYGIGVRENGEAYYNALLHNYTTTDMTAEEVHGLGLTEVQRIHEEMREIMEEVGFDGDLSDFFAFMREDPQFFLPNTDEGREAYLEQARGYVDGMRERLPDLFGKLPEAPLEVRRVEPFRERAAGKAFYNQPAEDGSRPGIFYANLADMANMPTYQLEALVYHEGIPGHHMQRAIQIEMEGLPKFRQFGGYTAFTEGWGLYSELVPKEIGFYDDPYSDFGRLAMELWRAARLVVDTGFHAKGWEMQEAIDYLQENTPNPEGDTIKAIERYIVYPGQATSYKIGMLKLIELREDAKARLGDRFDIRAFHDFVLTGGPLPLSVLEARVDGWVNAQRADGD
ncbi:DUF885 domain-containing protein [Parvularcula dongshanensis]|uniref:Uncharacterized protein (DUF885 family) n=1 Tax=Parvularcula dongshanensis TaxID=1173995 RepID=A0A840I307_9PROT|nr:DUF885 domain-containing protein [Parvularcula dongshanensis]MBB4658715.1 uncharacterized protein (DUF885 family) [Parvularcula dongshanensis]